MPSNWMIFNALCRVVGGRDDNALKQCLADDCMPQMITMAAAQGVLPALAVRCFAQQQTVSAISNEQQQYLRDTLLENTRRNMHIVVQSIKLIRALNSVGITPLILKGTARLLTENRERPGFHKQADIDLIVRPESLVEAGDAMLAEGYGFYPDDQVFQGATRLPDDTPTAIKISAAHHHLPPLVKSDQIAFVELHRHFLPKRFQRKNPLDPLFDSASRHEIQGGAFLVPSTEYQIIHTVLGKFVHDGYLARRDFPIREAVDYMDLMDTVQGIFDSRRVERHCGNAFNIFSQLVTQLMGYEAVCSPIAATNIKPRIRMMQWRYDSPAPAMLLDRYARAEHLSRAMLNNPAKLTAYLRRQ